MQKEPFANELIIDELQHINVLVCLRYVLQIRVEITTKFNLGKITLDSSYILHCQTVQLCKIIYHLNPHPPGNYYAC